MFQQEKDREQGYRPGVGLLLIHNGMVLLARRESIWSCINLLDESKPFFEEKPPWMYGWDIPQGGINPGETFQQAIHREIEEELGDEWNALINDPPRLIIRNQLNFPVKKDGIEWLGKVYYYHAIQVISVPMAGDFAGGIDYIDWVYGFHQDEGMHPYPVREFPGGVLFMNYEEACDCILKTQRGQKGQMLLNVLNELKVQELIC
jgi:hypothetical protein